MKFSIIVATYNSSNTVSQTIQSILEQSYPHFEIIVQDGVSKDDTLKIIEQFNDSRINILSVPDKGIYDAMNKGITRCSGEIICILNSDDFYNDNFVLENVVKSFEDKSTSCVYGNLVYVDIKNIHRVVRKWISGPYQEKKWLYGWMPPHPSFFVRKGCYDKFGTFDLSLKSSADYELMLRFLYKNKLKVVYLPKILVQMRTGGQSNASFKNRISANKEDKLAWKINGLKPYWFTTILKPLRKIIQYLH